MDERDEESGTEGLVAVLCWGGAALRLKDRDEWIGWPPQQKKVLVTSGR